MYPVHHLGSGDALPHDAGAKARQTVRLHELAARGAPFHVPPAFIVPPTAIADVLAAIGIPAADVDAEFAACVQAADLDLARRWRQRLQVVAFPPSLVETLRQHWTRLTAAAPEVPLAVRSSFHAEDSAVRSFAGVFESVLDVRGPEMLVRAARSVYASLLSDRSLAYLADDPRAAVPRMSLIVQRMAIGPGWTGGVAYSRAPELHAAHVSLIAASRDAPSVTSGATIPEEYLVLRTPARAPLLLQRSAGTSTAITGFLLDDEARASLVRALAAIEDDFGHPVELEWTRRPDGCVFVLQARAAPTHAADALDAPVRALRPPLLTGLAIGHGEFAGTVCRTDRREDATHLGPGDVLVTRLTTPDWDPILARVGALVTAAGGRTSHAARLARERRMLAVVGCGPAIDRLSTGRRVLLVCADGLAGELHDADVPRGRAPPADASLHVGTPLEAFSTARRYPHPPRTIRTDLCALRRALRIAPEQLQPDAELPLRLRSRIAGYPDARAFVEDKFRDALALVCAAFPSSTVEVASFAPDDRDPFEAPLRGAVTTLRTRDGFNVHVDDRGRAAEEAP